MRFFALTLFAVAVTARMHHSRNGVSSRQIDLTKVTCSVGQVVSCCETVYVLLDEQRVVVEENFRVCSILNGKLR